MAKFRTKPFEIDAVRYDGRNLEEVDEFTGKHGMFMAVEPEDRDDDPEIIASVFDKLHSTWVGVKKGQWIIRGQKGEFYPCDPEIFAAKYEALEDEV